MPARGRVAVVGAGIYGATIAIGLAREGYRTTLYDPLGVLRAASAINQFRIHRGYHYPRSADTIAEILEARSQFVAEYRDAIVNTAEHYYAIPRDGSLTSPEQFEDICARFALPLQAERPDWIDFGFISRCYRVEEQLYDPDIMRQIIKRRIEDLGIEFVNQEFDENRAQDCDAVIYATYAKTDLTLFRQTQLQVAEKVLIELPAELRDKSLVVIDGPFTGFDPYGGSPRSQFGSGKHSVHWASRSSDASTPERYQELLNRQEFSPVAFSHFHLMAEDAAKAVPLTSRARYLGSRFTLRLVEHAPRRIDGSWRSRERRKTSITSSPGRWSAHARQRR